MSRKNDSYLRCCKVFGISRVRAGETVTAVQKDLQIRCESTLRTWCYPEVKPGKPNYYLEHQQEAEEIVGNYFEKISGGRYTEEQKLQTLKDTFVAEYRSPVDQKEDAKVSISYVDVKLWVLLRIQMGESAESIFEELGFPYSQLGTWASDPNHQKYIRWAQNMRDSYANKTRLMFCPLHAEKNVVITIWREFIRENQSSLCVAPPKSDWDQEDPTEQPFSTLWLAVQVLYYNLNEVCPTSAVTEESFKQTLNSDGINEDIYKHAKAIWQTFYERVDVCETASYHERYLAAVFRQYLREGKASEILEAYNARKMAELREEDQIKLASNMSTHDEDSDGENGADLGALKIPNEKKVAGEDRSSLSK